MCRDMRRQRRNRVIHVNPNNTSPKYWNQVLKAGGLGMGAGHPNRRSRKRPKKLVS